jgi:hypothetical protein
MILLFELWSQWLCKVLDMRAYMSHKNPVKFVRFDCFADQRRWCYEEIPPW